MSSIPTDHTLVARINATKMSTIASLAFLVYDHLITSNHEAKYVWNRRWSFGKALFIWNRYFGLIMTVFNTTVYLSNSFQTKFFNQFIWREGISWMVTMLTIQVILQARIYAVYNRNKSILLVLIIGSVGAFVATVVLFFYLQVACRIPLEGSPGCHYVAFRAHIVTWMPLFALELVMCLMMLYRTWRVYVEHLSMPLLRVLLRDSILYFLCVLVVMVVHCVLWASAVKPSTYTELGFSWSTVIPCAMGSRLLLNMRKEYFKEDIASLDDIMTMSSTDVCSPVALGASLEGLRPISENPRGYTTCAHDG